MAGHPLAAGLTGAITVVSMGSPLVWGNPAAAAEKVATFQAMNNKVAIFGYPKGAMMTAGTAAARRVGFFATDVASSRLTDNGKKLLDAAIRWALLP